MFKSLIAINSLGSAALLAFALIGSQVTATPARSSLDIHHLNGEWQSGKSEVWIYQSYDAVLPTTVKVYDPSHPETPIVKVMNPVPVAGNDRAPDAFKNGCENCKYFIRLGSDILPGKGQLDDYKLEFVSFLDKIYIMPYTF